MACELRHGLSPGDRVLLAYQPRLDFVIALFACLSADLIAVPLPFPRSRETTHRFIHVFKDCDPRVILTNESNEALLRKALPPEAAALVASNTKCYTDVIRHTNQSRFDSDIKILQYTSGSTGFPKGVMLSNDNLLTNLEQIRFAFDHTPDSRGVIWLPHYHDMGLMRTLVSSGIPASGVSVEIRDPNTHQQCKNGELAEICVLGASVSRGYWQKQNPLDKGTDNKQWLKTGDIGFLKGQELYVTGRIKDLIIIRGQNFFAEDIKEIMRRALPKLEREDVQHFR